MTHVPLKKEDILNWNCSREERIFNHMHLLKLRRAQIYNRVTSEYTQAKTKFYFLCNFCIMRRMHLKLLQMNELRDSP